MAEKTLPQDIKDRYNKAQIAIDRKNYKYAIELLTYTINVKPDFVKGRQLLRFAELKRYEQNHPHILIRIVVRVLSFIPIFIAMVNETTGNFHNAMAVYEKILRKDPRNTVVLVKLGNLLKSEGMEETAAITLESAVDTSPKNFVAYELLGELYSNLGRYERARGCFKKALELRPHDAAAERGLKNLDALTTIDKSFEKKDEDDWKIREITE